MVHGDMKVYAVMHNYCTVESSSRVVSLHRSMRGAVRAMTKLKTEDRLREEKENRWADSVLYRDIGTKRKDMGIDWTWPAPYERYHYGIFEVLE
jgi:hypothetical protein